MLAFSAREISVASRAPRALTRCAVAALLVLLGNESLQNAAAEGDTRTLSFHHMHTKENITITFKREGRYDDAALKQLDWFMRDWRRNESIKMDPHLFDLLWEAYRAVDAKEPIQIVCGYRSPETNAMLRARSSGVAQFSQHTHGQAMDFYIPGVPLEALRNIGLRLQRGGVGFYPSSGSPFVHLDTGTIRHWPRMSRDQLVKVFPDGRTIHVPTDGQPLAGYALAMADVEQRRSGAAGQPDGADMNDEERTASIAGKPKRGTLAKMFGFGKDEDETAAKGSKQKPVAATRVAPRPVQTVKIEPPAAPVPMPQTRPAAPVVVAAAAPATPAPKPVVVATVKANDVFATRGYWAGAVEPDPHFEVASADSITTASIAPAQRSEAAMALAYAAPASGAVPRANPMGSSLPRMPQASLVQPAQPDTTIVVKQTLAPSAAPLQSGQRFDDPWLRAAMITPNVQSFMTTTRLGPADPRPLREHLLKPTSSLVMTFSADPHYGMVAEQFTGSAVVFLATASFNNRTAALSPK